ncbi:MAG TPA: maleylpyruvate isomerase N-terminal domain-containing protein [Longimicrobiales bacterium]|nr:maleylpyruvate isomerase N-terminal domain-containing protein [Longimicrobiales bacterium]
MRAYLARIEGGHNRIRTLAADVDAALQEVGGVCGDWSVRQLLAHMEAWNVEILDNLRQLKAGAQEVPEHDVDDFNRRAVEERKDWPWAKVLQCLRESQRALQKHLQDCAAEGWELSAAEREWVEVLVSHDEHHGAQLNDWLASQAPGKSHGA